MTSDLASPLDDENVTKPPNNMKPNEQDASPMFKFQFEEKLPVEEASRLCRAQNWVGVLALTIKEPALALHPTRTRSTIHGTTILHQAILGKGSVIDREKLIMTILRQTPDAAQVKNTRESLPLHVITFRKLNIDVSTTERLILAIAKAYPGGLVECHGANARTPLHNIFHSNLKLTPAAMNMLIKMGEKACFISDFNGYLPAHVACSRRCSVEALRMLLNVNPEAVFERTNDGKTLHDLAQETSKRKREDNVDLIRELNSRLSRHNNPIDENQMSYAFDDSFGLDSPSLCEFDSSSASTCSSPLPFEPSGAIFDFAPDFFKGTALGDFLSSPVALGTDDMPSRKRGVEDWDRIVVGRMTTNFSAIALDENATRNCRQRTY